MTIRSNLIRAASATGLAAAITATTVVGGGTITAQEPGTTPPAASVSLNPLAPQKADAAWYDFTIRAVGSKCGYRETVSIGQGHYRHRVMRNIKTWTSDRWQCGVMDEWVTNRTPVPYLGMPGG